MRKKLRDTIRNSPYRTQDKCAYELHIDSAILSRIINGTKDPTAEQVEILCKFLGLTEKEVNKQNE